MWSLFFWLLLALFSVTEAESDSSTPACAFRCWENTRYTTKCTISDLACFCRDVGFQNSVFQCIHSQCDTPKFEPALHFVISQCIDTGARLIFGIPPTRNHDQLRKREAEYLAGKRQIASGSGGFYPTESAGGGFPTQSVYYATQSSRISWLGPSASPSPSPLFLRRDKPDPEPNSALFSTSVLTITTVASAPVATLSTLPSCEPVAISTTMVEDMGSSGAPASDLKLDMNCFVVAMGLGQYTTILLGKSSQTCLFT
ncbi:hypothetical protein BGZ60DRAFT_564639 [Tricladium varicosporioides]|nr:hypothetical protein BGZ60DRAFT_564639 [Hymenoscyphus varicosporioides]